MRPAVVGWYVLHQAGHMQPSAQLRRQVSTTISQRLESRESGWGQLTLQSWLGVIGWRQLTSTHPASTCCLAILFSHGPMQRMSDKSIPYLKNPKLLVHHLKMAHLRKSDNDQPPAHKRTWSSSISTVTLSTDCASFPALCLDRQKICVMNIDRSMGSTNEATRYWSAAGHDSVVLPLRCLL